MIRTLFIIISLLICPTVRFSVPAQEQQVVVPYTLADRDRLIVIEARLDSIETRLDNLDKQIDDLKTLFYWGFGILISLFIFMLGYIIWDRRTAMKPALEQSSRALEENRNFIKVLRDYSKKHPDLAEILRSHGML